jgi:hypothetical protein
MIESYDISILVPPRNREAVGASLANPIAAVTVAALPLGAGPILLHFGHGDPGRPITQEGQTFEPGPEEAANGLFVSTAPGSIGGTLILVLDISFRTFREPIPVVDVSRAPGGRVPTRTPAGSWLEQLRRNFGL